jgi:hypothetical protein
VPRINRYSAVTQKMADRLAAAGYSKSPSTLESWARSGLAPRPVRFSRGRKGSTSAYPPGAFEQYLAVARVMQPGRDVREAALMLISDGDLPTSEGLFRRAVDYLFEGSEVEGDPLELADQAYSAALARPVRSHVQVPRGERQGSSADRSTNLPAPRTRSGG